MPDLVRLEQLRSAIVAAEQSEDIGDYINATTAYEQAIVNALGSDDAHDAFALGRMDFDDVDYARPSADLLAALRESFSGCGAHNERDASCPDCLAIVDIR